MYLVPDRSPRMSYHVDSLLEAGHEVLLVGYPGRSGWNMHMHNLRMHNLHMHNLHIHSIAVITVTAVTPECRSDTWHLFLKLCCPGRGSNHLVWNIWTIF